MQNRVSVEGTSSGKWSLQDSLNKIMLLLERQNELLEGRLTRDRGSDLSDSLTLEQQAILLIPRYRGNKSKIAVALGVNRSTVHRWKDFSDACERSNQVRSRSRKASVEIPRGAVSNGTLDAHSTDSDIDAWIDNQEQQRRASRRR